MQPNIQIFGSFRIIARLAARDYVIHRMGTSLAKGYNMVMSSTIWFSAICTWLLLAPRYMDGYFRASRYPSFSGYHFVYDSSFIGLIIFSLLLKNLIPILAVSYRILIYESRSVILAIPSIIIFPIISAGFSSTILTHITYINTISFKFPDRFRFFTYLTCSVHTPIIPQ